MTLWPTLILLCYISKVLIKGRESAVWLECSINPEYSLWAEKAFFSEKTKKTMTSSTTGCPLKGSRASYSVHGASLFFRQPPTRPDALKSTSSCSFNLDRFRRSTFYRPSAVNCCRCRAQSVFSCISPPVVLVASAVIQRLVFVMSLRTNSWVRNRNLPWKFRSVPCPPPNSHSHSSPSPSCTRRPSSHSQLFHFRHN